MPRTNGAQFSFEYSWIRFPPLFKTKYKIAETTAPMK